MSHLCAHCGSIGNSFGDKGRVCSSLAQAQGCYHFINQPTEVTGTIEVRFEDDELLNQIQKDQEAHQRKIAAAVSMFTPRFEPHVYINMLEACGAPMIDVKRFRDILATGAEPTVPDTSHGDAHRSILHRELGFDPGPLQMLLRMAAKHVNYGELYSAPPQRIIDTAVAIG